MLEHLVKQTASKVQPESVTASARRISPWSVDDVETSHHGVGLGDAVATSDGMMS